MKLEDRIKRSISNRKEQDFFLTSDFQGMGSRSAVASALASLVKSGFLVRVSLGVYVKTKWNRYAKQRVAVSSLGTLAPLILKRLGYKVKLGRAAMEYAQGLVTQIPNQNIYEIGNQRITRKIMLYGQSVSYEKNGVIIKN